MIKFQSLTGKVTGKWSSLLPSSIIDLISVPIPLFFPLKYPKNKISTQIDSLKMSYKLLDIPRSTNGLFSETEWKNIQNFTIKFQILTRKVTGKWSSLLLSSFIDLISLQISLFFDKISKKQNINTGQKSSNIFTELKS